MMGKLTNASCKAKLKKPGTRYGDGGGLFFRVFPGEKASWVYRYRFANREREMSLGKWPDMSLADARDRHAAERDKVRNQKIDPLAERQTVKSAPDGRGVPTFGEAADAYIDAHQGGWKNPGHRQQWKQTLTEYCAPIRDLPINEVDTAAVLSVLRPLWGATPTTGSRLRGRIEAILAAAQVDGHIDEHRPNPARWKNWLDRKLAQPSKLRPLRHHAAMPHAEVPSFFETLKASPDVAPAALAFLVLTAARSSEVKGMTWDEVDLDAKTWTVPAVRMKMAREHSVPLSDAAVEILRDQLKAQGRNAHCFPGARPSSKLSVNALSAALERLGGGQWTVHGFRSTFRSWCADQGVAFEVAESCLAHAPGNAVVQAYQRSDMLERRRPVMEKWARHLTGESGTVVPITSGRRA
jgi:integrase